MKKKKQEKWRELLNSLLYTHSRIFQARIKKICRFYTSDLIFRHIFSWKALTYGRSIYSTINAPTERNLCQLMKGDGTEDSLSTRLALGRHACAICLKFKQSSLQNQGHYMNINIQLCSLFNGKPNWIGYLEWHSSMTLVIG